jgi:endoglycosylceramidase
MHQDIYGEGFQGDGAPLWTCDASHYANYKPVTPWFFNDLNPDVVACYDGFWNGEDLHQHYIEAWRRVAARMAGYDNVVGFDVMNEPYWGSAPIEYFETLRLQPFYEEVVPAVRAEAPHLVAFLEPGSNRNLGGHTGLTAFPFEDVVYAPHSYDRNAEQGNGFDPNNRGAILSNIAGLADEAQSLNAALWIGEYGGYGSGLVEYMTADYDGAGAVAGSTMYWSYDKGGGYSMLNADGTESQPLVDTLVRPYPERVAGDPVSYGFDAPSSTFTFTYRADPSVTAPTLVSVPARVYPNGYVVECGGCANHVDGAELVVTAPPQGSPATITLHP